MRRTAAVALVLALGLAGVASAQVKSPADIAAGLEQSRGVKVLKIEETRVDGRVAYIVSVMNAGANSNAAFQVERILVDAETGAPIPTYRHAPDDLRHSMTLGRATGGLFRTSPAGIGRE